MHSTDDNAVTFDRAGCAALAVFDVIAHRWSALVIYALSRGLHRHQQLRQDIPEISQKVLTETLRRLEHDGLVVRVSYAENPPRVEYTLTPLGEAAQELLSVVCRWGKRYLPEIEAARQRTETR
jgi:DNA-binding HxlR family transcriptional regulator